MDPQSPKLIGLLEKKNNNKKPMQMLTTDMSSITKK